jgi:hypothetical protein
MKIDCILTSVNINSLYIEFIPIFIKSWLKILPSVDIKIVLIANDIPEEYKIYDKYIILFTPIDDMKTAFISQYIRLLYPALLKYECGVLITDMDMIPTSRSYYYNSISNIQDDKFIYYRSSLPVPNELAMCYNIATPRIWKQVFNINNIDDIIIQLKNIYDTIKIEDPNHNLGYDWGTDQKVLFRKVMDWHSQTNNFIYLDDNHIGYRRLDRHRFQLNDNLKNAVTMGYFSDYHAFRPYSQYKEINDAIVNSIPDSLNSKIHFVTYGDDKYTNSKRRIADQADNMNIFDNIIVLNKNDLPDNLPDITKNVLNMPRGGGYWIWKPIIIKTLMDKINENDIIVYVDSGSTLNKSGIYRFNQYINMLSDLKSNKSMIRFKMNIPEYKYTSTQIFEHFKVHNKKNITDDGQYMATSFLIRKCRISETIINLWYKTAIESPLLFTDMFNNVNKNNEFVDNRHDQSIFSVITKIFANNVYTLDDETNPYNEHNPIYASRIRG